MLGLLRGFGISRLRIILWLVHFGSDIAQADTVGLQSSVLALHILAVAFAHGLGSTDALEPMELLMVVGQQIIAVLGVGAGNQPAVALGAVHCLAVLRGHHGAKIASIGHNSAAAFTLESAFGQVMAGNEHHHGFAWLVTQRIGSRDGLVRRRSITVMPLHYRSLCLRQLTPEPIDHAGAPWQQLVDCSIQCQKERVLTWGNC